MFLTVLGFGSAALLIAVLLAMASVSLLAKH